MLPVYYDAWLNDNATDPILSIVYEIINQLDLKDEIKGKPGFKEVIKGVAIPFVEKTSGVNIEKFLDSLDSKDYLEEISTQQLVHERVNISRMCRKMGSLTTKSSHLLQTRKNRRSCDTRKNVAYTRER